MMFVGRSQERRLLRGWIEKATEPVLVHVQGMPGSGKTQLLAELARDVEVLEVPGSSTAERAQWLLAHLASVTARTVLLVDDWQDLAHWESALVELIELARGPLVVLAASRVRPRPALLASKLSPLRLHMLELSGLDENASVELLAARGVPTDVAHRIHHATGGQPFAMLLLSQSPTMWPDAGELGEHATDVLIHRLVGAMPADVRTALDLLALIGELNEAELRSVLSLDAERSAHIFDALQQLALVRKLPLGISVHPIVRTALLAELHRRDPARARSLVAMAMVPIERSLAWTGQPRDRALCQLRDIFAAAPQDRSMVGMFQLELHRVSQARAADLPQAFALIEQHQGTDARALAEQWVARDRSCITVSRTGDTVEAVMIRVDIRGPVPVRDPVIDTLVDVLTRRGMLRPTMLLRATRFFVARNTHQLPSPELGLLGAAVTAQTLDTVEPFISVQHLDARTFAAWSSIITTFGSDVCREATASVGGHYVIPCVNDTSDPGAVFLAAARRAWGDVTAAEPVTIVPLAPDALTDAVSDALRHMRDEVWLESSALARHLFDRPDDRAASTRTWLEDAVAATASMRRGDRVTKALRASYEGHRSIDEAASVAGMATTTLKRYRRMGIEHIARMAARGSRER